MSGFLGHWALRQACGGPGGVQVAGSWFPRLTRSPVYLSGYEQWEQAVCKHYLLNNQRKRNQVAWLPCVLVLFQVLRRPL